MCLNRFASQYPNWMCYIQKSQPNHQNQTHALTYTQTLENHVKMDRSEQLIDESMLLTVEFS